MTTNIITIDGWHIDVTAIAGISEHKGDHLRIRYIGGINTEVVNCDSVAAGKLIAAFTDYAHKEARPPSASPIAEAIRTAIEPHVPQCRRNKDAPVKVRSFEECEQIVKAGMHCADRSAHK